MCERESECVREMVMDMTEIRNKVQNSGRRKSKGDSRRTEPQLKHMKK